MFRTIRECPNKENAKIYSPRARSVRPPFCPLLCWRQSAKANNSARTVSSIPKMVRNTVFFVAVLVAGLASLPAANGNTDRTVEGTTSVQQVTLTTNSSSAENRTDSFLASDYGQCSTTYVYRNAPRI